MTVMSLSVDLWPHEASELTNKENWVHFAGTLRIFLPCRIKDCLREMKYRNRVTTCNLLIAA